MAGKIKTSRSLSSVAVALATTIVTSFCSTATAMPEHELQNGGAHILQDFIENEGEQGVLLTPDNIEIRYLKIEKDCNGTAIVFVPGWSESYLKYSEILYDLHQYQFCLYSFDHRGQGLSTRLADNPQMGYVDEFSDYVEDFKLFLGKILERQSFNKVYVISRSMGGLVALNGILDNKHNLDGIVLLVPMLQLNTDFWPENVALAISSTLDWVGWGDDYVFGHGDYVSKPFSDNITTHSEVRYAYEKQLIQKNNMLKMAGVSNRWLKTSISYTQTFRDHWSMVDQRILLFQAGDDHFVLNDAQDQFCSTVKNCEKVSFKNARHELLMEVDEVRNTVLQRILHFVGQPEIKD